MGQLAVLAEELGLDRSTWRRGAPDAGRMQCGFDFDDPIGLETTVAAAQQFAEALGREVDLSTIGHPDTPMQGWRDRRAVHVPPEILEAARIGRERLAAREAQRQVTAPGDGGVGGTSLRSARPS
jgi:hypothetical protein